MSYELRKDDFEKNVLSAEMGTDYHPNDVIYCTYFHLCHGRKGEYAGIYNLRYVSILSQHIAVYMLQQSRKVRKKVEHFE